MQEDYRNLSCWE